VPVHPQHHDDDITAEEGQYKRYEDPCNQLDSLILMRLTEKMLMCDSRGLLSVADVAYDPQA
jgi:hypothetical protein